MTRNPTPHAWAWSAPGARAPHTIRKRFAETEEMHHLNEKGTTVKPTEHAAQPVVTPNTGLFATLRGLLQINGTGTPKTDALTMGKPNSMAAAPRRLATRAGVPLLALAAALGALGFTSAPALAAPEAPAPVVVESVEATSATFQGELNPGKGGVAGTYELVTYEFLYDEGGSCEGGSKVPIPPGMSLGGGKEALPPQEATRLTPHTEYAVCLLARNSGGETTVGPPVTFTTPIAAPAILSESVTAVEASDATLEAQISPDGAATKYHFEYGVSEAYGTSTPEGTIEETTGTPTIRAHITGLTPDTTYHYRVSATNESAGKTETTTGEDKTLTTPTGTGEPTGTCPNEKLREEQPYGLKLPDCRAYEQVSPLNTEGQDATDSFMEEHPRAAENGEAVTYASFGSFADAEGATRKNQFLSRRGLAGWSTQAITPLHDPDKTESEPTYATALFTPNLERGLAFTNASLTGEAPVGEDLFGWYVAVFATHSYQYVQDSGAAIHTFYPVMGASADLSHVVFPNEATPGTVSAWVAGHTSTVSLANDGELIPGSSPNAVSSAGTRVYFSAGGQLYLRVNPEKPQECLDPSDACTVDVSGSQKTTGSGPGGVDPNEGSATYQAASADGSRVFFTSDQELTNDANTGVSDRQELVIENASSGTYTLTFKGQSTAPLAYNATPGEIQAALQALSSIGAGNLTVARGGSGVIITFLGSLAASEQPELSVDGAALNSGASAQVNVLARPGSDLYEYDTETGKLTDLSVDASGAGGSVLGGLQISEDGSHVYFLAKAALAGGAVAGQPNLYLSREHSAPVLIATLDAGEGPAVISPDGGYLAFIATERLTAYDNAGVAEIYLYDAATAALTCASCDPTGARPTAQASFGGPGIGYRGSEYQSRNLFDDGRLFFESADALVPHASDGLTNVYEYEGGHIYAISDVAGGNQSFFLDASASGGDVFFGSADQLLPQDTSNSVAVWDARTDGGFPVTVAPPSCDNGDACKPPPTPQPPVFGPPASATFSGAGNVPPTATGTGPPKGQTPAQARAEELKKALKTCRRDKARKKRAACERSARKKYGPAKATKANRSSYDRRASR